MLTPATASSDPGAGDDAGPSSQDDPDGDAVVPRPGGRERDAGGGESGRPCPLCGVAMARRHCKYVCARHGVVYDCSDTFW